MNKLDKIRQAEKESHIETYTTNELFQQGTWLQKPVKTVTNLYSLFDAYTSIRILDLGSGVGRNCIPMAQHFSRIDCSIDCVDILDLAIKKLYQNSIKYGVEKNIIGHIMSIEDYIIKKDTYDIIIAISALEHIASEDAFQIKLKEIQNGIRENGVVCLVVNSEVSEIDKNSGKVLEPQFEINISANQMQVFLGEIFENWIMLKSTVVQQSYTIKRDNRDVDLNTKVITFVVRKKLH